MKKICIDIGHAAGTGATGNGLEEHGVAVQIAAHLARYLRVRGHAVSIIDYPSLSNAADLNATVRAINAGSYNLSVSLHCDSSDNPDACGAHVCHHRTYHKDGTFTDSVQGKALASAIAGPLCKLLPGRADPVQARPEQEEKALRPASPAGNAPACGPLRVQLHHQRCRRGNDEKQAGTYRPGHRGRNPQLYRQWTLTTSTASSF
ncbi:N-acetylmuramoyl-L-alanine amidase [Akkermansia muciniphila]|uniref:N-acetylmuramoyl-L-alanine amidase family protein n=1 Tax=Akkermansia muciniphila TaxID=239935 RepID=UPI0030CF7920